MVKIIDGKELAQTTTDNLKFEIENLKKKGVIPALVVIVVGEDQASQIYVKNKHRVAESIGIKSIITKLPSSTSESDLLALISEYNENPDVHGILVQLPLPKQINEKKITESIRPEKDVDGFHPVNIGRLVMNDPLAIPCTPMGIMRMFTAYDIDVEGKNAVVVGRSNIVGKPMAALLLNANATVTVTHSHTQNLSEITKQADILVVAIGQANFIKKADVKQGAVVIDVGMNRLDSGKLAGDVDKDVSDVAGYLTPVPKGVGPMTIAMLMEQTIELTKRSVGIG
ncbi:bifunctional methylenetetrahydrofolate dehydrogenase/methenyltetrahydrofolate cyclohydrolase FolD [Dellaglioa algida]|uniref:Bifunctional protein FolD n=1 Tax=Dellaglioa algida DSM 15638 TaxID=1423719 RepID=A0A0R1HJ59_9LACO|nr:bifunctional methylenetetrahydrofolate dehydrogenase/methenyltetrahydrofolate cyclohydrolase FolD [Dellaglioa algida]KRK46486.1 methylenetetrahydrofolate dehydrogenase [Dellaglioa algida DSM 15638]MDK1727440.1 bifunctional methylenetetrahydrofolate dehydrogenase/methenyltetrahydrofolate cyclohydrolase FolD [Dellaglioa algida]MDK1732597.1 bifunctional methylenetetrahydrofolate dehydrogenase/methenyltetrahydrofolate cyclohydrolase FolD [Dellaglioa algida]MDK1734015.1 bifunctional methylenetetr